MSQCKQVAGSKEITIMETTKLICKLGLTAEAILSAQVQVRYLQRLQIQALKVTCYHGKIYLDNDSMDELFWWLQNLRLYNGNSIILPPTDLCIAMDVSTKWWEATCQGISTGELWPQEEQKTHISILELKAVHLAILTSTKFKIAQRMDVQMDNKVTLSYLVKIEGTHNKDLLGPS